MFKPVPKNLDVPALEHEIMDFWKREDVERQYLHKNDHASDRFSFLDGPITANNPMGVHHAWGRTYKDLWQRYNTMLGRRQRYQNGFDCQGLWVEVTVERELGFTSKTDIERYGIGNFVRKCKENVFKNAAIQTEQSKRLGYFMDWENSYFTLSDQNNYSIWNFLKRCHEKGLLYQGTDVMPWCTRCGTGISETEAAEGYKDITHRSVFVRFPLLDKPGESLLVWTTTPWTLTSNVAVAVNPDLVYLRVRQGGQIFYLAKGSVSALRGEFEVLEELVGRDLLGWRYTGPFDDLPASQGAQHIVIAWDDVTEDEGTGLVHIAPGCGKEDFQLGKDYKLQVIAPLDQFGVYGDGFGWLSGRNVHDVTQEIFDDLQAKDVLYGLQQYKHRYPTCWRCTTELVFRLVDEWFISMDELREPMMEVVRQIRWLPTWGLDRELDWLRNMDDWMISKKRYWGLALPFWFCPSGHMQVVGSKEELFDRGVSGLEDLESPHRPWIDAVTIPCPDCGELATRIPDVGNPWLDAGIVSFSTLRYETDPQYWREWFPANFITESFPGQFRNWFYSLLAMSTVLENTNPFETVLGFALVRDENGREMHKSWGNSIPFDEAADRSGADVMRWLFLQHNPESNVNFGWHVLDEVRRRLLTLWNTYLFFVTYANVDGWIPVDAPPISSRPLLDRWVLSRLQQLILDVRDGLDKYDGMTPARNIEAFVEELSTWYIRRSRRRFWKAESDDDKSGAYATLYECLTVLSRLLAPFTPFLAEALYQNLVRNVNEESPVSVHLTDYPHADARLVDGELLRAMALAQEIVALGRAARDKVKIKVRQPLATMYVRVNEPGAAQALEQVKEIILEELNVRGIELAREGDEFLSYSVRPNLPVLGPRFGKQLGALRLAIENLDPSSVARAVVSGETVVVRLDGETVELQPADILVSAQQREGFAAMASSNCLVALDTHLTEELILEGLARDVVRNVNSWRKDAGLEVQDRIHVRFEGSENVAEAIEQLNAYVCTETLSISFVRSPMTGIGFQGTASFSGEWLRVEIERA